MAMASVAALRLVVLLAAAVPLLPPPAASLAVTSTYVRPTARATLSVLHDGDGRTPQQVSSRSIGRCPCQMCSPPLSFFRSLVRSISEESENVYVHE